MGLFKRKIKKQDAVIVVEETTKAVTPCTKELDILLTESDKTGRSIESMSNFLSAHISKISLELGKRNALEIISDIPPSYFGMMNDVLEKLYSITNTKISLAIDFNSLPADILAKYKRGELRLGESRQVDGNLRAVLVDKKGDRVKDLTLKKIITTPDTFDLTRSLCHQMQMQQINSRLVYIQERQEFQINTDWNERVIAPFFRARDHIKNAQEVSTEELRVEYLKEAKRELGVAISNTYGYIEECSKELGKLSSKSRFFVAIENLAFNSFNKKLDSYMLMLSKGLQYATTFVGIQVQVFDYLEESTAKSTALSGYYEVLREFVNTPTNFKQLTACEILHNYFPYTEHNKNYWSIFASEMKTVLKSDKLISNDKDVYLLTSEE